MIIETNKDGEEIRLVLKGRLDSLSSDQLKNELLKCFMQGRSVIVDMESVEFISSAGLQALFVGQKAADSKNGKLLIINTNDAVADVFRVSGFYSILNVREG